MTSRRNSNLWRWTHQLLGCCLDSSACFLPPSVPSGGFFFTQRPSHFGSGGHFVQPRLSFCMLARPWGWLSWYSHQGSTWVVHIRTEAQDWGSAWEIQIWGSSALKYSRRTCLRRRNNASFFGNMHYLPLSINSKLLSYTVRTVLFFFLDCNYNCFTGKVITDQVDGIRRSNLRENFQATFNVKFLCGERGIAKVLLKS